MRSSDGLSTNALATALASAEWISGDPLRGTLFHRLPQLAEAGGLDPRLFSSSEGLIAGIKAGILGVEPLARWPAAKAGARLKGCGSRGRSAYARAPAFANGGPVLRILSGMAGPSELCVRRRPGGRSRMPHVQDRRAWCPIVEAGDPLMDGGHENPHTAPITTAGTGYGRKV